VPQGKDSQKQYQPETPRNLVPNPPASPHADHPNTLLSSQTTRHNKDQNPNWDSFSAEATRTTLLVSIRDV
jgi:hypothetical protein